jgi:hypothetical protein
MAYRSGTTEKKSQIGITAPVRAGQFSLFSAMKTDSVIFYSKGYFEAPRDTGCLFVLERRYAIKVCTAA